MTQTIVYTGRPARVVKNPYLDEWEKQPEKVKELTDKGVIPFAKDFREGKTPLYNFLNHITGLPRDVVQKVVEGGLALPEVLCKRDHALVRELLYLLRLLLPLVQVGVLDNACRPPSVHNRLRH